MFEDLDDIFLELETSDDDPKYWVTSDKMNKIEVLHDYLDSLEHPGTVLSFATILKIGRNLNNGQNLDSVQLGLLYEKLKMDYFILNCFIYSIYVGRAWSWFIFSRFLGW